MNNQYNQSLLTIMFIVENEDIGEKLSNSYEMSNDDFKTGLNEVQSRYEEWLKTREIF